MHAAGRRAEHGRERAEAARSERVRPRGPSHRQEQGARVERGNVAQPIAPRAVRERNNFPQVAATNSEHHRRSDDDATRLRQVFATHSGTAIDGCPPGLAAKQNGCRPPGLARQADADWRRRLYEPAWWGLNGVAGGPYYYGGGYLYRLDNAGTVASYIPLLAGALAIGNQWPSSYAPVELPSYYQRYYGLGPLDSYRYADNTIYDVDPTSSVISSIAALLTGDDFTVGRRLPVGYDVYNVPYPYRGQYADTPDAWYRYSDGYVYEVDPKTQLIQEAIQLLGA